MFALTIVNEKCLSHNDIEHFEFPTSDQITWVHLQGDIDNARHWLVESKCMDNACIDALCNELTRPRLFVSQEEALVLTLRASGNSLEEHIEQNRETLSLRLWMSGNLLISISRREVTAVSDTVQKLRARAKGIRSIHHLLFQICDKVTDALTDWTSELEETLEQIEDAWDEKHNIDTATLHGLRQDMSQIRRYLGPQVDTFERLGPTIIEYFAASDEEQQQIARWREIANAAKRDFEALSEMRERVSILQDAIEQQTRESTHRTMYLLSVVATFFLPLTFITGLLGMNVNGIPINDRSWAFWAVCAFMLFLAFVQWLLFKWWQWLK